MTEPRTERPKDDPFEQFHTQECSGNFVSVCGDSQRCDCGLDAALAAVDARHADEIEKLKAEHAEFRDSVASALVVENPDGPVSDEAIVMAAYESTMQLLDPPFSPSTQLAGMGAERDTLRAQLAAVQSPLGVYARHLRELAQTLEDGAANPPAVETVPRWTIRHLRALAESMENSKPLTLKEPT